MVAYRKKLGIFAAAIAALGLSHLAHADTMATWISEASGEWSNASMWGGTSYYPENGNPAGTNYQAIIGATGGTGYAVTLNIPVTLDSFTLGSADATLDIAVGGSMQSLLINLNAGTLALNQGTIANSTINLEGGSFAISSGTLNASTIYGGDLLVGSGDTLYVQNGLTVSDNNVDLGGTIYFDGPSQTINNLDFNCPNGGVILVSGPESIGKQTLTLASGITASGRCHFANGHTGDTLINYGTIDANSAIVDPNIDYMSIRTDNFTNHGTVEAVNGGEMILYASSWTNAADGKLNANAGALKLGGNWTNSGTITASNGGTLELGGTFTTGAIGNVAVSADTKVDIAGVMNNAGAVFSTGQYGGTWSFDGTPEATTAVMEGGTINLAAGNLVFGRAELIGVSVIGGDVSVPTGGSLTIDDVTIADHNLTLGLNAALGFDGPSQTFDNLNIAATGGNGIIVGGENTPTTGTGPLLMTLGMGTTLSGNAVFVGGAAVGNITIVNDGLVDADLNGQAFSAPIHNNVAFINNGTIEATNGGIIDLASFTNNGTVALHNGTFDGNLAVSSGELTGTGRVSGSVILSVPSTLGFEIGGIGQGTSYDSLTVAGNIALAGDLEITFENGFESLINSSEQFTVLTGALSGSFDNVLSGGRLETTDGFGSFQVNYGGADFPDEIVLSDYQSLPEPGSIMILSAGLLLCGGRARNRNRSGCR